MSLPLLILRAEPVASATAAQALARGFKVHKAPLFEIVPKPWAPPPASEFDAVLVTSANAMRHGGDGLALYQALPVLAVGDASAAAARTAGFANVSAGMDDAQALIAMASRAGYQRLLHLSGHVFRAFDPGPCVVTHVTVYAADLNPEAQLPSGRYIALVHSARAATRLEEVAADRSLLHLVCISAAVAQSAGQGWASVAHAASPSDAAMLEIAAQTCQQAIPPK